MNKQDLILSIWMNWDYILNNYLDDFRDLVERDLNKKTVKKLKHIIRENNIKKEVV